ncbi:sugar ABC transporter substrate-binding protein [Cellulomonas sp. ES6]|uniref:ABC transporter substrate-binding protein n=1 Tax=Cellulomonas sp. ES6 TaxID=3039384 RepID=UPI0024B87138|nr:sugar ABC transporter substrate-binding protein [Cellulomonas sp. ES6]WHP18979.1 sugar ABC transporter substrate-binding protein [Cellulomonas sp. ES6]
MASSISGRKVALVPLALAGAVVMAGCAQGSATSGGAATDGQTVVRYMNFTSNDGHEEDLDAIVAAYEEEHPDVDVQVETLPYADYFTKLQTAFAGQTVADVVDLNYENFVSYAEAGSLAPLEDVDTAPYQGSLLESFQLDGTQYGLPSSYSNVVLFYNKGLFDAAGLDYPTADWTWEDEQAAATALTDAGAGVWGDYQPVSFHEFYKALAQAGGEFFTEDGSATAFDSPEGLRAAQWLVSKPGTVMPTEADGAGTPDFDTDLFKAGKLAMWHSGIWMFGGLAEVDGLDWDIVVEPGETTHASALFTNGVAVAASSEVKEAAQDFAQFLTASSTAVDTRVASSWELPPVDDADALAPYLEQTPPANRQAVLDALDTVALPPVIASQQEMQDAVNEELSNAAAGRKTVEQALTDAASRVDALLG